MLNPIPAMAGEHMMVHQIHEGFVAMLEQKTQLDRDTVIAMHVKVLTRLDELWDKQGYGELSADEKTLLAGYESISRMMDEVDERIYNIPGSLMSFPTVYRDITQDERLIFRNIRDQGQLSKFLMIDGRKSLLVIRNKATTHLGTPYNEAWYASSNKNHVGIIDFLSGVTQRTMFRVEGKLGGWMYS